MANWPDPKAAAAWLTKDVLLLMLEQHGAGAQSVETSLSGTNAETEVAVHSMRDRNGAGQDREQLLVVASIERMGLDTDSSISVRVDGSSLELSLAKLHSD